MSTEEMLLEVKNLSKQFGGIKAVDNVNLQIRKGEIISVIGPNGAGKTTVFNLLTGIYKPDHGEIYFRGEAIHHLPPIEIVHKGIARTFQNIRLFHDMRVIENVLVGTHHRTKYTFLDSSLRTKRFRKEEDERVVQAIRLLQLPYGDQRKVEIARAIATGAKLILLDEPAAGMNPQESLELMGFIRELRDMGYTILMIEHDMSVVMNISDRIYVIDHGKPIADGLPKEIANNKEVIEAYLGGLQNAENSGT
mgnify:CR=1 FL=1